MLKYTCFIAIIASLLTSCSPSRTEQDGQTSCCPADKAEAAAKGSAARSTIDAKSYSIIDVKGNALHPLNPSNKVNVVIFITTDCPIANALCPEINSIHADYKTKGVNMTLVHVDPDVDNKMAASHARDYELSPNVIVDTKHTLVKLTGAETTPEAAVITPTGKIAYLGRINDRFSGYGDRKRVASEHNLRDALDAVLANREVAKPRVPALGCFIPS